MADSFSDEAIDFDGRPLFGIQTEGPISRGGTTICCVMECEMSCLSRKDRKDPE